MRVVPTSVTRSAVRAIAARMVRKSGSISALSLQSGVVGTLSRGASLIRSRHNRLANARESTAELARYRFDRDGAATAAASVDCTAPELAWQQRGRCASIV